jgi:hypothetical protein
MGSGSSGSGSARVRNTLFGGWARQPALASKAEFYCRGAECGTLCTALRHHCLTQPDLNLCPKCFKGGCAPAHHTLANKRASACLAGW